MVSVAAPLGPVLQHRLVVEDGQGAGRTIDLVSGTFVVLGRTEGMAMGTQVVLHAEQRLLEDEDHRRVEAHLAARASRAAAGGLHGARGAVDEFSRGEDFELSDDAVSQTHAMVFCDDAGFSIVDVASKNGTWVNGDRVSDHQLVAGDVIRVGETRLTMRAIVDE